MEGEFEVEEVEVGMSGCNKEKLLVTGTDGTIRVVIEVEGEEVIDGNEERVLPVGKIIVLDEGTRGM